jgi:hypothetical protein
MRTAAVVAGLLTLAGCASSVGEVPAWFTERQAEADSSYPSLRDVPNTTIANTDPEHWAAVESELLAAKAAMQANPRNEPAPPQDSDEFVNQAREELEEARQAHPD